MSQKEKACKKTGTRFFIENPKKTFSTKFRTSYSRRKTVGLI